jgi:hypothetical protein
MLTLEDVNRKLKNNKINYRCLIYDGNNSNKSRFVHVPSGEEGCGRYKDILKGKNPSWSPQKKSWGKFSTKEINKVLQTLKREYECLVNAGTASNKSVFRHIPSGIEGTGCFNNIKKGHHPLWSPECTSQPRLTLKKVNQDLHLFNRSYLCLVNNGSMSNKSVFRHIPSGIEGTGCFNNLRKGHHPLWSPECTVRIVTLDKANGELTILKREYECIVFINADSNKSVFRHIPSGIEGLGCYARIKDGKHPSWSPACRCRQALTLDQANNDLIFLQREYKCLILNKIHSNKSKFLHIPSGTMGYSSFSNIKNGTHPSWSPACVSRGRLTLECSNQDLQKVNSDFECLLYDGARSNRSIFRHIPSGMEGYGCFIKIRAGIQPHWSPAINYSKPSNENLCIIYLVITNKYNKKHTNGKECITVGITSQNTKKRYDKATLLRPLREVKIYNCRDAEKELLTAIKNKLGEPHVGHEAWYHNPHHEKEMITIFDQVISNYAH